ncbi:serine/threonine-protein kinase [Streptomyces profundus]|uniref:serine/threonine-protein kinase n=1 Tax=Streptomyces profundus TaxID=2867410 RepID=UPI001D169385|nr:serine/threonine-protein kinase [Streptomyces sp. MA3_2.13]UED84401.1 serine/threonine protein kinase [Streptomyces sp. MA3_2.13]
MAAQHEPSQFSPLGPADPQQVAGYRLVARLGAGGMGSVYLSFTPGGQPIAVKVVRGELADDPAFRRRFEHEVRAAREVQGIYTVPVLDSNTEGAAPWLATAFVPGLSLHEVLAAHGPLPAQTVLLLVGGIAEALQSIHSSGIVHRDLKPGNVLLSADGPKVIDFGIARAADVTALTGTDVRVGTPAYMAPEQIVGTSLTPAADVFALGIVAYFAATGGHPFGEGAAHAMMYRMVQEAPDLSAAPEALHGLIAACLAKEPTARPTPAQIIEGCRALSPGQTLQRDESWLPAGVGAAVAARRNAVLPVPEAPQTPPATPPPPSTPPPGAFGPPATPPAVGQASGSGTPPPNGPDRRTRNVVLLVVATAVVATLVGAALATKFAGTEAESTNPSAGATDNAGGPDDTATPDDDEPADDNADGTDPEDSPPADPPTTPPGREPDPDSNYTLTEAGVDLDIVAPIFHRDTTSNSDGRCVGGNATEVDLDGLSVDTGFGAVGLSPATGDEMVYIYCDEAGLTDQGIEFHPQTFVGLIDNPDLTAEECYEAAHTPNVPHLIPIDDIWEDRTLRENTGLCFETPEDNVVLLWINRVTPNPHNKDLRTYLTTATQWSRS